MKSIIKDKVLEHMIKYDLLTPPQHGFSAGRSCVTQLLTALNCWTKCLEEGCSVDIISFTVILPRHLTQCPTIVCSPRLNPIV